MAKGGYQIIDLENRNFTLNSTQYYKGIYEKLKSNRSPVLFTNVVINGVEFEDRFVTPFLNGATYEIIYAVGVSITQHLFVIDYDTYGNTVITLSE